MAKQEINDKQFNVTMSEIKKLLTSEWVSTLSAEQQTLYNKNQKKIEENFLLFIKEFEQEFIQTKPNSKQQKNLLDDLRLVHEAISDINSTNLRKCWRRAKEENTENSNFYQILGVLTLYSGGFIAGGIFTSTLAPVLIVSILNPLFPAAAAFTILMLGVTLCVAVLAATLFATFYCMERSRKPTSRAESISKLTSALSTLVTNWDEELETSPVEKVQKQSTTYSPNLFSPVNTSTKVSMQQTKDVKLSSVSLGNS